MNWQQVTIVVSMLIYAIYVAFEVRYEWYLWPLPLLYPCVLWGIIRHDHRE